MANITFNVAKGRGVELYKRAVESDPANCAIILVPIETDGLETDAVLKDKDTLADVLSGTTDEQATMGRKILTDADLAALPDPDDDNDKRQCPLPDVIWAAAAGNPISKILVAFDYDTTAGDDSAIVPMTLFDFPITPTGVDVTLEAGPFWESGEPA